MDKRGTESTNFMSSCNTWMLYLIVLQSLCCGTFMGPSNSALPFVFISTVVALWNWTPVQTEGHNCSGNKTTEWVWRGKGASSHGNSCENKTKAIKCWWDCKTKVVKWHLHQKAVGTTGHVGPWKMCHWWLRGFWSNYIRCLHLVTVDGRGNQTTYWALPLVLLGARRLTTYYRKK